MIKHTLRCSGGAFQPQRPLCLAMKGIYLFVEVLFNRPRVFNEKFVSVSHVDAGPDRFLGHCHDGLRSVGGNEILLALNAHDRGLNLPRHVRLFLLLTGTMPLACAFGKRSTGNISTPPNTSDLREKTQMKVQPPCHLSSNALAPFASPGCSWVDTGILEMQKLEPVSSTHTPRRIFKGN